MTRAYIGLGANLGDARATLDHAIRDLASLRHTRVTARSSYFRTAPVDAAGPDFLNAVVALDTALDAFGLLRALQAIEQRHGRVRPHRNAPRTLDLDLLLFGEERLESPELTLPHPRMADRAFVLAPLAEIAPGISVPGEGSAADLLRGIGGQRIERID